MKKDLISYAEFAKLDLRVGEIKDAQPLDNSEKLLELTVDLGEGYGTVQILSGIKQFYSCESLIGKKLIFLANLEPKPMAGKISHGMLLAVDNESKPVLIEIEGELANGSSVC